MHVSANMGKATLYEYHSGKEKLALRSLHSTCQPMSISVPHLHLIAIKEVNVWSVLLAVLADQQQDRWVPCLIQHCLTVMDCREKKILQLLLVKENNGLMGNVTENKKAERRKLQEICLYCIQCGLWIPHHYIYDVSPKALKIT